VALFIALEYKSGLKKTMHRKLNKKEGNGNEDWFADIHERSYSVYDKADKSQQKDIFLKSKR
jgi:hypothetical protein